MTSSDSRAPPALVPKVCPYCGAVWEHIRADGQADEAEMKCRNCKRLIRYRVASGQVIVLTTR
jgi:hypothetical protein